MRAHGRLAVLIAVIGVACGTGCSNGSVAGTYVSERDRAPKDQLTFAANGTFTLEEDGGTVSGTYRVNGRQISLATTRGQTLSGTLEGAIFTDQDGNRWTKQ